MSITINLPVGYPNKPIDFKPDTISKLQTFEFITDCIGLNAEIGSVKKRIESAEIQKPKYNKPELSNIYVSLVDDIAYNKYILGILQNAYQAECLSAGVTNICNTGYANTTVSLVSLKETMLAQIDTLSDQLSCNYLITNDLFVGEHLTCKKYIAGISYNEGIMPQIDDILKLLNDRLNGLIEKQEKLKNFTIPDLEERIVSILQNMVDAVNDNTLATQNAKNITEQFNSLMSVLNNPVLDAMSYIDSNFSPLAPAEKIEDIIGLQNDKTFNDFMDDSSLPFKTITSIPPTPDSIIFSKPSLGRKQLEKNSKNIVTFKTFPGTKSLRFIIGNSSPLFVRQAYGDITSRVRYTVTEGNVTLSDAGKKNDVPIILKLLLGGTDSPRIAAYSAINMGIESVNRQIKHWEDTKAKRQAKIIELTKQYTQSEKTLKEKITKHLKDKINYAIANLLGNSLVSLSGEMVGRAQLNNKALDSVTRSLLNSDLDKFVVVEYLSAGDAVKILTKPNIAISDVEEYFGKKLINTPPDLSIPLVERPEGITYPITIEAYISIRVNMYDFIKNLGYETFKALRQPLTNIENMSNLLPEVPASEEEFLEKLRGSEWQEYTNIIYDTVYFVTCLPKLS